MRFELFESDGSRWLCKNIYAGTQIMMYEMIERRRRRRIYSLLCGIGERFYWLNSEV
jgi:hypothetical protein